MKHLYNRFQNLNTLQVFRVAPERVDTPDPIAAPRQAVDPQAAAAAVGDRNPQTDFTGFLNRLTGRAGEDAAAVADEIESRIDADDRLASLGATLDAFAQTDLRDPNNPNLFNMFVNLCEMCGVDFEDTDDDTSSSPGSPTGGTTSGPRPAGVDNPEDLDVDALTAAEAYEQLVSGGVLTLTSSGAGSAEDGTSRAPNRTCLEGIRESTVRGARAIQSAVGGSVLTCTGGTEDGHASGALSHAEGFKLDYAVSNELVELTGLTGMNQRTTMTIGGQRMNFYRHAPDHFDVQFLPA